MSAPADGRPRAVLLVSSYLPELLGVCDRIAVMCARTARAGACRRSSWTEHALLMDGVRRARRLMTLRRFLDESGVLVGLVLVALVFGLLIGPAVLPRRRTSS